MQEKKPSSSELYVKKFGGTSVCSLERIEVIAEKIATAYRNGEQQVIVLSAMAGETNRLFSLGRDVDPQACKRELDALVSTGEQVNVALMAMALIKRGVPARSLTGSQACIFTCSQHGSAKIEQVDVSAINQLLSQGIVPVVTGFQGQDQYGNVTTLGRGGSDTSAVALAAALRAKECLIFTDVDGVYHTDPKLVEQARKFESVSFSVMHEMAKMGAKVLHPDSVEYAQEYRVPIRVLSSFSSDDEGTLIADGRFSESSKASPSLSIVCQKGLAILSVNAENNQLFDCNEIEFSQVCLQDGSIWRAPSEISVEREYYVIQEEQLKSSIQAFKHAGLCYTGNHLSSESELVCVSLIAEPEQKVAEKLSTVLDTLGNQDIHVKLASTSEKGLSIIVDVESLYHTVRTVNSLFELDKL